MHRRRRSNNKHTYTLTYETHKYDKYSIIKFVKQINVNFEIIPSYV